jgi:hypothetical protein
MKKINLNKKVVSVLTHQEQAKIKGGGTTSYSRCTGFGCCSYKDCYTTEQDAKRCNDMRGTRKPEQIMEA